MRVGSPEPKQVSRFLTRSDILLGTEKREEMTVTGYDKDVIIRPLSEGEICKVFDAVGGIGVDSDGYPDTVSLGFTGHLGLLRRIAQLGMVEPQLQLDDIGSMPFGIPGEIASRVLEISGMTQGASEVVGSFREAPGGKGAPGDDDEGDAAGQKSS